MLKRNIGRPISCTLVKVNILTRLNLVCLRRLKLSRDFRHFFNGQMKLNEFECNVGSHVFNKELPKRERKSIVLESGYAVLVWSRDFTESAVFVLFCFRVNFIMAKVFLRLQSAWL